MEVIGQKMVACSKLYLPGDFQARVASDRVKELARTINEIGEPINEPVVRKSDGKVICGVDRIAAHFYLKRDMVKVKLIECSDEEAERISVYENLHRRSSPEERAALMQQAIDFPETVFPQSTYKLSKLGRPRKVKTVAREEVAMRLGVSPDAIRKREYRQRGSSKNAEPIRDLGMNLDPEWRLRANEAKRIMTLDAAALRKEANTITKLLSSEEVVVQRPRVQRLLELVTEAADLAKELIPSSICPGCKGLTGVQEKCPFCLAAGYVGKGQEPGIPRELWDNTVVSLDGEIVAIKALPGVYDDDVGTAAQVDRSDYATESHVASEEDWGF
jgi:ParB-like chromosome segregation protein Spo0J